MFHKQAPCITQHGQLFGSCNIYFRNYKLEKTQKLMFLKLYYLLSLLPLEMYKFLQQYTINVKFHGSC